MIKRKKFLMFLIFGLLCAVLPFVGVAKVKAATVDDISSANDLKGTSWLLNETLSFDAVLSNEMLAYELGNEIIGNYYYGDYVLSLYSGELLEFQDYNLYNIISVSGPNKLLNFSKTENETGDIVNSNQLIYNGNGLGYVSILGEEPRKIKFNNVENEFVDVYGGFVSWLKNNATLEEPRTIPFRISLITDLFDNTLGYVNSNVIDLPVYDDTVSFTVSFQNNQMITGQINHPEADAVEELTFSNGERVFYTIYYNDTNIDFKLYFYGEQLYLYEAVMYNTEVLDSSGNYQATVATYSEGISEQEMQTLKNSGIYEASFEITIPQENELVTDAQLMLEMGISSNAEPPEMENISNIMTGIFTLVSSFLSIQLGFITLGQIIGLILAIGVVFFIFYVWNGGRNGN